MGVCTNCTGRYMPVPIVHGRPDESIYPRRTASCVHSGLQRWKITACEFGVTYKKTSTYDAAEFYAPEDEHRGYEDDNNEY